MALTNEVKPWSARVYVPAPGTSGKVLMDTIVYATNIAQARALLEAQYGSGSVAYLAEAR